MIALPFAFKINDDALLYSNFKPYIYDYLKKEL